MTLKFLLLLLLSINFLHATDLDFLDSSQGPIILQADGSGQSPNDAKKNALQELVFNIKSSVETSMKSSVKVETGDKVSRNTQSDIKVSGKSYFEGLQYSDPILKDGYYQVRVVVTQKSLESTLKALYKEISLPIETLSKKQQRVALEKLSILRALLSYKTSNMDVANITPKKLAKIEFLLNRSLNMAKVIFKTNTPSASIELNDKTYTTNTPIFLEPGNYSYTIKSDGYHSENGKFYAQAGSLKSIKKSLIKQSSQKLKVYVFTDNQFDIKEVVDSILSSYGVGISRTSHANNAFGFKFKKKLVTKLGTMKFYKFSLTVDAYKGSEIFMTKTATLKKVADSKLMSKSSQLAKALTKALLKRIDMQEFTSNKEVDYNQEF